MSQTEIKNFRQGVGADLQWLAKLHDSEISAQDIAQIQSLIESDQLLTLQLESTLSQEASTLFNQALAQIPKPVPIETLDKLAVDYASIYLNHAIQASPYESVWLDEDNLAMQTPMFEVRECYKKYNLEAPDWRIRADDHLTYQLQFIALLFKADNIEDEPALAVATDFLDQHLLLWIEDFSRSVTLRCDTPFYAGLAMLTFAYVDELRDLLERLLDKPRPTEEEQEQAQAQAQLLSDLDKKEVEAAYMPGQAPSW